MIILPRTRPAARWAARRPSNAADRAARAAAGAQLEHLTEEDQDDDHRCGLKVDGDLAVVLHRGREQAGHEHRESAEEVRGAHADGNQREHVQMTATTTERQPR